MNMLTPAPQRRAMSLIEVTMALGIFLTVLAIVMQSLIATRQVEALGNAQDDLARDANRILETISRDLAESGWHFPDNVTLTGADRSLRYYPYVQQPALGGQVAGRGTQFTYTWRDAAMINLEAGSTASWDSLPGAVGDNTKVFGGDLAGYLASYRARSQELIYIKQATMGWSERPWERSLPVESFPDGDWTDTSDANRAALNILYPSGWQATFSGGVVTGYIPRVDVDLDGQPDVPYGRVLQAGELDMTEGDIRLRPMWETIEAPDWNPTDAAETLRDYMFAVVPSPLGGMGRLVRAHRATLDAGSVAGSNIGEFITPTPSATGELTGMRVDAVLSENVVRILFDTFRTDANLDVNQIRVRIFLARPSVMERGLVVHRRYETIVSMRARLSESDRINDLQMLNTTVGFTY